MREELKNRIKELQNEVSNFSWETDERHKGDYEKRTLEKLDRLKTLWEDMDY